MFIRSIKVPSSSGVVHEYVRVVESVREQGRVKQRLILNLGRRDTLLTILPLLQRFLHGDAAPPLDHDGPIQALDAAPGGRFSSCAISSSSSVFGNCWTRADAGPTCKPTKTPMMIGRAVSWPCWPIVWCAPSANTPWRGGWKPTTSVITSTDDTYATGNNKVANKST